MPTGAGRIEKSTLLRLHPDKRPLMDSFGSVIGKGGDAAVKSRISRDDSYRWLVALGQRQATLVGHVEAILRKWEAIVRSLGAKMEEVRLALVEVEQQLRTAMAALTNRDASYREAEDDYRMARVLADENWVATELRDEERTRLLENPVGLVYARVRQTLTALPLSDPLELRHHVRGEVVPGVADDANLPIPEALWTTGRGAVVRCHCAFLSPKYFLLCNAPLHPCATPHRLPKCRMPRARPMTMLNTQFSVYRNVVA